MEILKERTFTKDGFEYSVQHVYDPDPDLSYLDDDMMADSEGKTWAKERRDSYNRDEWHCIGIAVEIRKRTSVQWAEPAVVGRASLWGIESDSEKEYLATVEDDMIADAEADLAILRKALCETTA